MKSRFAVFIALVVVVAAGCAGAGESVSMEPNVDVTGKWIGHWWSPLNSGSVVSAAQGTIEMTLAQSGSQAAGDLRVTGPFDPSGPIQVTISGNTVHIIQPSKLTGTLTVQGDSMSGRVIGKSIHGDDTLQRQK